MEERVGPNDRVGGSSPSGVTRLGFQLFEDSVAGQATKPWKLKSRAAAILSGTSDKAVKINVAGLFGELVKEPKKKVATLAKKPAKLTGFMVVVEARDSFGEVGVAKETLIGLPCE